MSRYGIIIINHSNCSCSVAAMVKVRYELSIYINGCNGCAHRIIIINYRNLIAMSCGGEDPLALLDSSQNGDASDVLNEDMIHSDIALEAMSDVQSTLRSKAGRPPATFPSIPVSIRVIEVMTD